MKSIKSVCRIAMFVTVSHGPAAWAGVYPVSVVTNGSPTAAETTAVRRIIGPEWAQDERDDGHDYKFGVGHADLNGDGRPDLLVQLNESSFCGSAGCSGYALLKAPGGYAIKGIDLANYGEVVHVLASVHKGMHDLRFDDSKYIFKWDGHVYR